MFILFLLVHLFFAFGFYIVNSPLVAWFFGIFSIITAIFFSPFRFSKKNKTLPDKDLWAAETSDHLNIFSKRSYTLFFQKNILIVAVSLFYLAITGILWSISEYIWKDFSFIFLSFLSTILSISLVLRLWKRAGFGEYENIFLYNLLGVWLVWTAMTIYASSWYKVTALIFLSALIITLVLQAYREVEGKKVNKAKILFFGGLIEIILFLEILIGPVWIGQVSLLLILGVIYFEGASLVILKYFRWVIRSTALILVYFSTLLLWYFFITATIGFFEWVMLIISSFFNFYVHRRFENYPSLLFTAITPFILIWVFFLPPSTLGNYILYCIFIGGGGTLLGRIFRTQYMYDEYIFQTVTIGALLASTGYYFIIAGFEGVLQISSILLMFSGILFISFLQIRKK